MIPEKYSRKPYAVYLKNMKAFNHLQSLLVKNDLNQTWHNYCENSGSNFKKFNKLGDFYYYPITHYGVGNYGCDFNSDLPHS